MEFLRKTWAEISLSALRSNIAVIKSHSPDCDIMAVVKANAYGHTVSAVAPVLTEESSRVSFFAVSSLYEALDLREKKIKKPILILGYTPVEAASLLYENDITQTVFSAEYAEELNEAAIKENIKMKVHIKLDTGMGRIGFNCRSDELLGIEEAITAARKPGFNVCGVFTHFAVADRDKSTDDGFTDSQHRRFKSAVKKLCDSGFKNLLVHCSNSAAILLDDDKRHSMVREGIALYGLSPNPALSLPEPLSPVMSFKTVVTMVKEINAGDSVGYGRTFIADKKRKIATLAVGYADGYPRTLSNRGYVLINGQKANIVGRVCMDQMSVDVTDIESCKMGDEVILFGKGLPVEVLADLTNTINYEIVCGVSARVPRVVIDD